MYKTFLNSYYLWKNFLPKILIFFYLSFPWTALDICDNLKIVILWIPKSQMSMKLENKDLTYTDKWIYKSSKDIYNLLILAL